MALFRLVAAGITPGETWNFGIHAESTLSVGDASSNFGSALSSAWNSDWAALLPAGTTITVASARLIDPTNGRQSERSDTDLDLSGTDATGQTPPPQVAVVVSTRTTMANRSGRGRFYLPGPASDQLTAGQLTNTARDAYLAGATSMFSDLNAAGLNPVIWHRPTSPDAGTTTPIISLIVDSVLDTQRRRRDKLVGTSASNPV